MAMNDKQYKRQPDPSRVRRFHPAFVAGFLEADGCISVSYNSKSARWIQVHVLLVQKEPYVVEVLRQQYGGSVDIVRRGERQYYRWDAASKNALEVLKDIQPYSFDKAEQVDLAIGLIEHLAQRSFLRYQKGKQGIQLTITDDEIEYRRSVWSRMKELNTCHKAPAGAETKPSDTP